MNENRLDLSKLPEVKDPKVLHQGWVDEIRIKDASILVREDTDDLVVDVPISGFGISPYGESWVGDDDCFDRSKLSGPDPAATDDWGDKEYGYETRN